MEWFQTPQRGGQTITPGGAGLLEAEVVSVGSDGVYVVIPTFDPERRWGPCPFTHPITPERGDRCLVGFSGEPPRLWIVAVGASAAPPPGGVAMEVWRDTPQSIPHDTVTPITWEEGAANNRFASTFFDKSNPTQIVFREPGQYLCILSVTFDANATGLRYANIFKAVSIDGSTAAAAVTENAVTTPGEPHRLQVVASLKIVLVPTFIECRVRQTSGGALSLPSDFGTLGFAPCFQIQRATSEYKLDTYGSEWG